MGNLYLEKIGKNDWHFSWKKDISETIVGMFFDSLDVLENGDVKKARKMLEKVTEDIPEFIDAWHYLSLLTDDENKSKELNEKAITIGLSIFPKEFNEKSLLEWGWTENRPFLRAYYQNGLILLDEEKIEDAVKIFRQIISWNPNDNQGARSILSDIFIENSMWNDMIDLSKKYPNDYSPEMMYGIALSLYKTGNIEEATKKLKKAIKSFPLCKKILLEDNPKKPKQVMEGYISVGGEDQAYCFWEEQGQVWKDDELRKWLKNIGE